MISLPSNQIESYCFFNCSISRKSLNVQAFKTSILNTVLLDLFQVRQLVSVETFYL